MREYTMFQSTPVIANGRIRNTRSMFPPSHRFNPRPLLLTGESDPAAMIRAALRGFNPRPLLLTGESVSIRPARRVFEVSIHARYC